MCFVHQCIYVLCSQSIVKTKHAFILLVEKTVVMILSLSLIENENNLKEFYSPLNGLILVMKFSVISFLLNSITISKRRK